MDDVDEPFLLYALLLKATLTSFSGLASLPMVRNDLVVERKVLTDRELNTAVVAGRGTSPGRTACIWSAWDTTPPDIPARPGLALMTPAFLIIPMMRWIGRRAETPRVKSAIRAVVQSAADSFIISAPGSRPLLP